MAEVEEGEGEVVEALTLALVLAVGMTKMEAAALFRSIPLAPSLSSPRARPSPASGWRTAPCWAASA